MQIASKTARELGGIPNNLFCHIWQATSSGQKTIGSEGCKHRLGCPIDLLARHLCQSRSKRHAAMRPDYIYSLDSRRPAYDGETIGGNGPDTERRGLDVRVLHIPHNLVRPFQQCFGGSRWW